MGYGRFKPKNFPLPNSALNVSMFPPHYSISKRAQSGEGKMHNTHFRFWQGTVRFPIASTLGPSAARRAPKPRELAMSAVLGGEIGKSDSYTVYAGSLDDPSAFHPTFALFAAGRPDWAIIPPPFKVFDRVPG
jgi:hypothetical protein